MKFRNLFFLIALFFTSAFASDHGIYFKVVSNVTTEMDSARSTVKEALLQSGFNVLNDLDVATPDLVREDEAERTGYKAAVIVFASPEYNKMLTSYGDKYLVAGLLRIGFYQDPQGIHIELTDPETINRVIFNDLDDAKYAEVVAKTQKFKEQLLATIHGLNLGENVSIALEPVRDDEDLRDASKDMFMMVGPMTFFEDEDQFPVIYTEKVNDPEADLEKLADRIKTNINQYKPTEDDADYNWSQNGAKDLHWKIVSEMKSPDGKAIVLGITRPRTEALSFHIAGKSRMDAKNLEPGLDHVTAYPIEVLLWADNGEIKVQTQREMFRMDMYFWDAGKMAFMTYKNMPSMLDESIKKALLNIDED